MLPPFRVTLPPHSYLLVISLAIMNVMNGWRLMVYYIIIVYVNTQSDLIDFIFLKPDESVPSGKTVPRILMLGTKR